MDLEHQNTQSPSEPDRPSPSVLLIVVSVVVVLVSATTVSVAMVGIELLWPDTLIFPMLLTLGIGLATMVGQYLGTVRGRAGGARYATIGSLGCFAVLYVSLLVMRIYSVDWTQPNASVTSPEENWLAWPIIAIASLTCGWCNGRWTWQLMKYAQEHPPRPLSITLRELITFCAVLGLLMIPASYRASVNPSLYRANVAVEDAPIPVPESAEAIQYERERDGRTLVSYEIDEPSFRKWLAQSDSVVLQHGGFWEEITSPLNVHRPDPSLIPLPISDGNHHVTKGLAVYWKTDTLHHVITYDRATGTAFYQERAISD
ncbi:hypothetical protein [Bremerella alba]|nr:hypothetical protein [Bremerella alba]